MKTDLLYKKSSCLSVLETEDGRVYVTHLLGRMRFSLSKRAWNLLVSFSKPRLLSSLKSNERKLADLFAEGLLIRPTVNNEKKRIQSIYQTALYSSMPLVDQIYAARSLEKEELSDFLFEKVIKLIINPGICSLKIGDGTYLVSTPFGVPVHIDKEIWFILQCFKKATSPLASVLNKPEMRRCIHFLFQKQLLVDEKNPLDILEKTQEDVNITYPIENRWRQRYRAYSLSAFAKPLSHRLRICLLGPCNIQLMSEALEQIAYYQGILPVIHTVLNPDELADLPAADICICSGLPYAADLFKFYLNKDEEGLIQAQSSFIARTDDLVQEIRKYSAAKIFVFSVSPPGLNGQEVDSLFFYQFRKKLSEANEQLSFLFSQMSDVHLIDYGAIETNHLGFFWDDVFNGSLHHSALSSWQWVSLKPSFAFGPFDSNEKTKVIPPIANIQQDPAESLALAITNKILSLHEQKIRLLVVDGDDLLWNGRVGAPQTVFDPPLNFYADVEKYFYSGIHEALFRVAQSGVKLICLSSDIRTLKKRWNEKNTVGYFIQPSKIESFISSSNQLTKILSRFEINESETCWLSLYNKPQKGFKGLVFEGNRWEMKKFLLNHPAIPNSLGRPAASLNTSKSNHSSFSHFDSAEKITRRFHLLLCKLLECTAAALSSTDDLRSLGLDSLQSLHLLTNIETEFDIAFPETTYTEPVVFNKKTLHQHLRRAIQEKQLKGTKDIGVDSISSNSVIARIFNRLAANQHPWTLQIISAKNHSFHTGSSLLNSVHQMAAHLKKKGGFRSGQSVLFLLTNEEHFVIAFLACLQLGLVPVLTGIPEKKAIRIWSRRFAKKHSIQHALMDASDNENGFPELLQFDNKLSEVKKIDARNFLFYISSSGTTGEVKLIGHTNSTLLQSIHLLEKSLKIKNSDTVVSWMPVHHTIGLINHFLMPLLIGAKSVIFSPTIFSQHPSRYMKMLADHYNVIAFMPNFALAHLTQQVQLAALTGKSLHHVKAIVCAGEYIDAETMESFYLHFGIIGFRQSALLTGYGMAETAGIVTQSIPYHTAPIIRIHKNKFITHGIIEPLPLSSDKGLVMVSSGRVDLPGSVRISNDDKYTGQLRMGSIQVRMPSLSPSVKQFCDQDGFYSTGDNGFLYEENLYVVSREKEVLVLSGRTIPPQFIEQSYSDKFKDFKTLAFELFVPAKGTNVLCIYIEAGPENRKQQQNIEMKIRTYIFSETKLNVALFFHANEKLLQHTKSGKLIRSTSIRNIKNKFFLS